MGTVGVGWEAVILRPIQQPLAGLLLGARMAPCRLPVSVTPPQPSEWAL